MASDSCIVSNTSTSSGSAVGCVLMVLPRYAQKSIMAEKTPGNCDRGEIAECLPAASEGLLLVDPQQRKGESTPGHAHSHLHGHAGRIVRVPDPDLTLVAE